MKYILVVTILLVSFYSCDSGKNPMVGEWEIIEFGLYANKKKASFSDEKILRQQGAVWNLNFMKDGSFKQNFNMRNEEKKMEYEEGIYEIKQDSLIINFKDYKSPTVRYSYVLENNVLTLSAGSELMQTNIVSKFRKK